jgi:hypothetical protein
MSFLPQFDNFVKVCGSNLQNASNIAAARIPGPHRIRSIRECYRSIAEFHDNLSLRKESMHVTGLVIQRIGNEHHTVEP